MKHVNQSELLNIGISTVADLEKKSNILFPEVDCIEYVSAGGEEIAPLNETRVLGVSIGGNHVMYATV